MCKLIENEWYEVNAAGENTLPGMMTTAVKRGNITVLALGSAHKDNPLKTSTLEKLLENNFTIEHVKLDEKDADKCEENKWYMLYHKDDTSFITLNYCYISDGEEGAHITEGTLVLGLGGVYSPKIIPVSLALEHFDIKEVEINTVQ